MSLPRSSQCYKVIHRRLRSPCDPIPTPESALAAALGQYCSISGIANRRNASNVPGALENRKRLGKRHMGELNFGQTHASVSLWELANSVDLTQWKWTPPTSFEARHAPHRGDVRSSFLEHLATWIYPLGSQARVESSGAITGGPNLPWTLSVEASAEVAAEEPVRVVHRAPVIPLRRVSSDVLSLRLASREVEELLDRCLHSLRDEAAFAKFRRMLKEVVAEARVSTDTLHEFLVHINLMLRKQRVAPWRVTVWSTRVYLAVLDGLSLSRSTYGRSFASYEGIYRMLLYNTSTLDGGTVGLFHRILAEIPEDFIYRFKHAIMTNLTRFIFTCSRPLSALSPEKAWPRNTLQQVDYMASGLQNWDTSVPRHGQLLNKITAAVANPKKNHPLSSYDHQQIRYAWLQLVARLPKVGYEFFVEMWRKLELDLSTDAFTEKQVCAIFLARIRTDGLVKDTNDLDSKLRASRASRCYAIIGRELWQTGQLRCVKMLAILLRHSGRDQDLTRLARTIQLTANTEATPLANLALGLGHSELALWAHFHCHQSSQWSRGFWSTSLSTKVLGTMINQQNTKVGKVLDALNIYPYKTQTNLAKDHVQKTQAAACAIARSHRLSDTEAITYIARCIKHLQSHGQSVPPGVLHALFLVITRDFASGRPGRTARCRWFLKLLLKETNEERVLEVGLGLKRWRARILRMRSAVCRALSHGSTHPF